MSDKKGLFGGALKDAFANAFPNSPLINDNNSQDVYDPASAPGVPGTPNASIPGLPGMSIPNIENKIEEAADEAPTPNDPFMGDYDTTGNPNVDREMERIKGVENKYGDMGIPGLEPTPEEIVEGDPNTAQGTLLNAMNSAKALGDPRIVIPAAAEEDIKAEGTPEATIQREEEAAAQEELDNREEAQKEYIDIRKEDDPGNPGVGVIPPEEDVLTSEEEEVPQEEVPQEEEVPQDNGTPLPEEEEVQAEVEDTLDQAVDEDDFWSKAKSLMDKFGVPILGLIQAYMYGASGNKAETILQEQSRKEDEEASRAWEEKLINEKNTYQEEQDRINREYQAQQQEQQNEFARQLQVLAGQQSMEQLNKKGELDAAVAAAKTANPGMSDADILALLASAAGEYGY